MVPKQVLNDQRKVHFVIIENYGALIDHWAQFEPEIVFYFWLFTFE